MKYVIALFLVLSSLWAKPLDLVTLAGEKIQLSDYEGNLIFHDSMYRNKRVLFFFFGTRCPHCEREIPQVNSLVAKTGLNVIGAQAQVNIDDDHLRGFVVSKGITYDVLDSKSSDRLVAYMTKKGLWIGGVPYYILVDQYGNLEPVNLKELRQLLGE